MSPDGDMHVSPDIVGEQIEIVSFDWAVSLTTDEGTHLRIESPFTIADKDGSSRWVNPQSPVDDDSMVVGLVHDSIHAFDVVESESRLTVQFASGKRIIVESSDDYEAWTLTWANGGRLVQLPGGGFAFWDPLGN
jgi:hypothetical protein